MASLFIERNTGVVTTTIDGADPFEFDAPLASTRPFVVVFHDNHSPVEMAVNTSFQLTGRKVGVFDGPPLLLITAWTQAGEAAEASYTFTMLIDSVALRAAIGTSATIALNIQTTWRTAGVPGDGYAFPWVLNVSNATALPSDVVPTLLPSIYRVLYVDNRFADMVAAGLFAYGNLTDAMLATRDLEPPASIGDPVLINVGFITDPGFEIAGTNEGIIIRGISKEVTRIEAITTDGTDSAYAIYLTLQDLTVGSFDATNYGPSLVLKGADIQGFVTTSKYAVSFDGFNSRVFNAVITSDGTTQGVLSINGSVDVYGLQMNGADIPGGVNYAGMAGGQVMVNDRGTVGGPIRLNGGAGYDGGAGGWIRLGRYGSLAYYADIQYNGGTGTHNAGTAGKIQQYPHVIAALDGDTYIAPPPGAAHMYMAGGLLKVRLPDGSVFTVGAGGASLTTLPRDALTGGTAGALDTVVTVGEIATNSVIDTYESGELKRWRLEARANATDSVTYVRPLDYNFTTNQRVWTRIA